MPGFVMFAGDMDVFFEILYVKKWESEVGF
nr:MAG TPA: hypothetical protein [Bacteriophage sp.]